MIKKLLIANRGEIAIRIIRACKEMGIVTVAVFSEADKDALHVSFADEAICIGPSNPSESYLNMNNIIQAACSSGCDAIHPGFGFLSENPKFAKLVEECDLIFVGPNHKLISMLGDKNEARAQMMKIGVPVIPGSKQILESVDEGIKQAKELGFPVLIKAASGGGGKGMRLVRNEENFETSYNTAKREAKISFNDDRVYLEKFIENPKHIEVQLIGDKHGNVIHLYERDCSLQRKNQKVLEEAPCYVLKDDVRDKLINDAVKACKHLGYDSVGTIEFLVDKYGNHYFMEMNTRVQVEHPITEMVTGVDIIKQQIRVASGLKLNIKQEDIKLHGYSIECRINAEDIKNNFAPSPGRITYLHLPGGSGVRVETAVYNNYLIPPYYDSMIMKLITYAPTRLACIKKMRIALEELIIEGVNTNIFFHYSILHNVKFVEGKYDTGFIDEFVKELDYDAGLV
ncbi:MAG TPA: acetyl-CoA carboxylase biotin carboxylase subunit [Erysipelotrichaceae bacterium]|nr:acetyl-CoA carboxylase biotin carboxylase subunit [Erysipelotrichaceae bacterium]